jgi:TetR/AcrR family transcriptional repressor of nem operon
MTIIIYYSPIPLEVSGAAMPRVSREQSGKNRVAIEVASARLFRERGLNQVSVADLMGAAGLTHGGFYGHFESKDTLAALACENAFAESEQRWLSKLEQDPSAGNLAAVAESYLTTRHRDHPGEGCAVAALAVDVAREDPDKPVRKVYPGGVRAMMNRLITVTDGADEQEKRQTALSHMATLVGALTLARATEGDPLSEEILAAAVASLRTLSTLTSTTLTPTALTSTPLTPTTPTPTLRSPRP